MGIGALAPNIAELSQLFSHLSLNLVATFRVLEVASTGSTSIALREPFP
jgi:hypothetical protein